MIKVVLQNKKPVDVVLHPKQGIQIEETKKYLFDPAVVQKYVDASAENAEASQQIYDQFVAESDEFKEEVKVISRETAKDEVSGVVAEVEANVEIAKEASQSAAESAEKAEQNAAKVPDPYEENTALIYKDGVVQWGKAAAENDGVSITENAKGQIQTIGVIDNNGEATKIWNGTRAEFDALEEKDDDTLYNVVDDETDDVAVSSFEIGDIGIAPLGIDETQNKRRYLNGQVILQSQFVSFTAKVKNAILQFPSLGATEENWQAEVTNSKLGQCGKFVIDDELGTIRLPRVVNISGLQDLSLIGNNKSESLPNITGSLENNSLSGGSNTGGEWYAEWIKQTGALKTTSHVTNEAIAGSGWDGGSILKSITFDASLSSSTYQDNAPVQQESVQYPYFIQVATGVEETVDVTREIELNNPFSLLDYKWSEYELNNASWLISNGTFHSGTVYKAVYELLLKIHNGTEIKEGVSVKLSTEAYTDTDFVINTVDTTFRLPIKVALVGGGTAPVITGGIETYHSSQNPLYFGTLDSNTPLKNANTYNLALQGGNGQIAYTTSTATVGSQPAIVPINLQADLSQATNDKLKLYFYVGETIQDANVINAGKALEIITALANADYVVETYRDEYSWYRVYKSGWVEQGGSISVPGPGGATITLHKKMKDNKYSTMLTGQTISGGSMVNDYFWVLSQSATSVNIDMHSGSYSNYCRWEVKGQGAK